MATARKVHAIHEAGHALIAHACGLPIRSVRIDVEMQSGTDVDRGFEPAAANDELRNRATEERIHQLLPSMQRDLAVALGGIAAEQLHGVYASGDPANRDDEERAEHLASNVTLGRWKTTEPRPPFSDREPTERYRERVKSFVDDLLRVHADALSALADRLDERTDMSGEEARQILEAFGVASGSSRTSRVVVATKVATGRANANESVRMESAATP